MATLDLNGTKIKPGPPCLVLTNLSHSEFPALHVQDMYAVGLAVLVLADQYVKLSSYTNIGTSAGAISM